MSAGGGTSFYTKQGRDLLRRLAERYASDEHKRDNWEKDRSFHIEL
jgi:hypothetical protein